MSRREGRDSDFKRHRSKFDREASPKRSWRDGRPENERVVRSNDVVEHADRDQKNRHRIQDALPLEVHSALDSKTGGGGMSNESDKTHNGQHEGAKDSSDPVEHDERGNAAQDGRSFGRRTVTERGWWKDGKDRHMEREAKIHDKRRRDDRPHGKADDNGDWRHDRFFAMEADSLPPPPARKRPAFREKKIPVDSENTNSALEPGKAGHLDQPSLGSERREDRDHNPRQVDRYERPYAGDRMPTRGESKRSGFSTRERHGGGGSYRGRDRFSGRLGHYSGGTRVEKWKHDLFDEANKSPSKQNEEDQIAKVEALLAS